ncbi:MAG: hypothetical protein LBR26_04295 [Prevotella sp.]|nr:hypothetical protein [Prevotella sp.]
MENMTKGAPIPQRQCLTVQHFDYCSKRTLNKEGWPYGPSSSIILHVTVKSQPNGRYKQFYQWLKSDEPLTCSLLFNAAFDSDRKVRDYDGAMVFTGYVVDVEETFLSHAPQKKDSRQMLTDLQILVSSIEYVGAGQNQTLFIIQPENL